MSPSLASCRSSSSGSTQGASTTNVVRRHSRLRGGRRTRARPAPTFRRVPRARLRAGTRSAGRLDAQLGNLGQRRNVRGERSRATGTTRTTASRLSAPSSTRRTWRWSGRGSSPSSRRPGRRRPDAASHLPAVALGPWAAVTRGRVERSGAGAERPSQGPRVGPDSADHRQLPIVDAPASLYVISAVTLQCPSLASVVPACRPTRTPKMTVVPGGRKTSVELLA